MKMIVKRRGFLGFLGGGIAAGPKKIAELAGINLDPLANGATAATADELIPGGVHDYGRGLKSVSSASNRFSGWWEKQQLARSTALKIMDPEWYREKRRQQANYVHTLDLDLAALHSVSMAGKVAIQRERNFARQLAMEERSLNLNLQEKLWKNALGDGGGDDD